MAKKRKLLVGSLFGLAAVTAVMIATFDWSRLRGPIQQFVGSQTGRELSIQGDIDVDLGWTSRVQLHGITLKNADWSQPDHMISIDRLQVSIRVLELLRGRVVLPELSLTRPDIRLHRNAVGVGNWVFDTSVIQDATVRGDRGEFPLIGKLNIDDGKIHYVDETREFNFAGKIINASGEGGDTDSEIRLDARGRLQQLPFKMTLRAGSLLDLRDEDQHYPLDLTVRAGPTQLAVTGSVDRPLQLRGLDLQLDLTGDTLADLYNLFGTPLPDTPPYELSGALRHRGDSWRLQALRGVIGESDIGGEFIVHTGNDRLRIGADLQSQRLHFDDLGPLIGVPKAGEGAAAERRESATTIPDQRFDLSRLRAADADVTLRAKDVIAPNLPIQDLELELALKDGVLRLQPLRFGVAGGELDGDIVADARESKIRWAYDVAVDHIELGRLITLDALEDATSGTLGGRIKLKSRGNSMHETAGNSDGRVVLMVSGGRISHLLVELLGLDAAQALGLVLTDNERNIPIRCAATDLDISAGDVRSRELLIDTEDTRINGKLRADLETESFALRLEPEPKDQSPFSARAPIDVEGSFSEVRLQPDASSLGLRAAAGVALGTAVAPAAALLAFIEPGMGENADCGALSPRFRDAHQHSS